MLKKRSSSRVNAFVKIALVKRTDPLTGVGEIKSIVERGNSGINDELTIKVKMLLFILPRVSLTVILRR